jgi:hypothetical protein
MIGRDTPVLPSIKAFRQVYRRSDYLPLLNDTYPEGSPQMLWTTGSGVNGAISVILKKIIGGFL